MNSDDKLKNKITRIITLVFTFNIFIIFIYSYFFLNNNLGYIQKVNKDILYDIYKYAKTEIKNINEIQAFEEKYDVNIMIKDMDSNIIFGVDDDKYNYSISDFIEINDTKYLIHISRNHNFSISIFITSLLLLEIGFALVVIIISYRSANKQFLKPIANLRHDMINYQNGKMPVRREPKTKVDELQNNFVSLAEAIELEKDKKNEVIASISHDIKTPLTSIIGYAQRLENANLAEDVKAKYIGKISLKSLAIKDIIDEFDDYLCGSLKGNLNFEEISIKDITTYLIDNYEDELKEKGITFKIINHSKRSTIMADVAKLKRVFSNIISNSVRYVNKKGYITVYINNVDSDILFEIADNGCGVAENNLTKIFDPLYTTDQSRKISGLGLSICRQIIKAHNGVIYAKKNNQGGLSIYFRVKRVK